MKWAALADHSRRRLRVAFDLAGARRMQQAQEAGNRIRPPLILSHFLLAAGGLVVWIIFLISDNDALAWIAFAILAVVSVLGFTMFAIWLGAARQGPRAGPKSQCPAFLRNSTSRSRS
ncbi:MAG: hypothetical protein ACXVR9_11350 [Gaiellaceae bacterium]